MAIGIDDLDDFDIYTSDDLSSQQLPNSYHLEEEPVVLDNDDDFMSDFLRSKGIDDPERIKFEDDNGEIQERSWNDLSREEQINILNTPTTLPEDNLEQFDDQEIDLINKIRESGLTPELYLQLIQGDLIVQEPTYKIDDLSDDELYILDLESRVGDLSDEDAALALAVAKQNEAIYTKQVEGIRKEYKEREDYQSQLEQAEQEELQREAFEKYQAGIVDAIEKFDSIGNLDLNFEDSDKDDLAGFILSQDASGNNYLWKSLQDPETLVKAAWFVLNGEEAFDSVSEYFKNLIKLISEDQYRKGLEDGRKGITSKPEVVINSKKSNQGNKIYKSIDDLDD